MKTLEAAVHYVVASTQPEGLGKVKLAKVLFFSDLDALRRTGQPITEAIYVKRHHGPMSEQFYATIDCLVRAGKIAQKKGTHFGYEQHRFWTLTEPDLARLSSDAVACLAHYTREVCDKYAAVSISDVTHNAAWELPCPRPRRGRARRS